MRTFETILREFSKKYGEKGAQVEKLIRSKVKIDSKGTIRSADTSKIVEDALRECGFEDFLQDRVTEVVGMAFSMSAGMDLKVDKDLTKISDNARAAGLLEVVGSPWDKGELTLSKKLHNATKTIQGEIKNTVDRQLRMNLATGRIARELYDGYGAGRVVQEQNLPEYINRVNALIRSPMNSATPEDYRELQKAIRTLKRNADKLVDDTYSYNHYRTAVAGFVKAVETGNEKAMDRAIYNAVQEKSRYVAERIARTEMARARYDMFIAQTYNDDTVVAYKWVMSTRHPHTDICDLYAEADLFGLGKGIFLKKYQPAMPAHPHCLCHYSEIYDTEMKKKAKDNVEKGYNQWLKKLTHSQRVDFFGVNRTKYFESTGKAPAYGLVDIYKIKDEMTTRQEEIADILKKAAANYVSLTVPKAVTSKVDRDYTCDFAKKLPNNDYDNICDIVDRCPDEKIRAMFNHYHARIKVGGVLDKASKGGSYYSPWENRVYYDEYATRVRQGKASSGTICEPPFEVLYHEMGHNVDFLLGYERSTAWRQAYSHINGLGKTIIDEVQEMVDKRFKEDKEFFKKHYADFCAKRVDDETKAWFYTRGIYGRFENKYRKAYTYEGINNEFRKLSLPERADISDMMGGATRNKVNFGFGHYGDYWDGDTREGDLATEAFAELFAAEINSPDSLKTIKKYLPKTYKKWREIVDKAVEPWTKK